MFKEFNKKQLIILLFPLLTILIELMFRIFFGCRLISPRALIYDISIGIIFGSFLLIIKSRKGKIIYFVIVSIILCFITISQLVYNGYFGDFYSIVRITNMKEFFTVKGEATKSFNVIYLLILLIPIVVGAFANKTLTSGDRNFIKFCVCLLLGIGLFLMVRITFINKMEDKTQVYLTDSYLYDTAYDKKKTVERFGVYIYTYRDLFNYVEVLIPRNNAKEIALIDKYFEENNKTKTKNEMTNIFDGKNLVFVVCESLNDWAINEEFTPTLYKMAKEGIYGTNYYSPVFTNSTVDAEYILNTGMVSSIDYGNIAYVFNKNHYPLSMANLFKNKGYNTLAFHNNNGDFYNRFDYYDILGYEKFYDSVDLEIKIPDNYGYDWPLDSELFEKTSEILINNYKDSNFLSYIMTVATHTPYDDNRIELKDNFEYVKEHLDCNSEVQYYFAAAMDLDKGISEMLEAFKKANILNDTVFVFVGDHYGYGMYHDLMWEYDTEDKGDFHKIHQVPMIIWSSNMEESKEMNQLISNFEIYPTICNMFGLDYNPTYCFGNDIFDYQENTILFGERNYWQDSKILFERGTIIEKDDDVADNYINSKNDKITQTIDIHQKILKEDYFRNKGIHE